jgi:hypothetical protein
MRFTTVVRDLVRADIALCVSRALGRAAGGSGPHYAVGVNDYAQLTQYRYDAGVDVTWCPVR